VGIRPSMQKMMLRHLKIAGASVCELGDQFCGSANGRIVARDWYKAQGCRDYYSLDANGLNGAVPCDLNKPVTIVGGFDIVTDFGTGEHIWNQDQVWRTLHDLCKLNGHIVFDRPTQGYGGHCFYLIDRSVIAAFCHFNKYVPVWIGRAKTTRGELLRGILLKQGSPHGQDRPFVTPQQGRYFKHLSPIMSEADQKRDADYKDLMLRMRKLVGKDLPALSDETTDKGIWESE
jgi:hypothetical protein